MYLIHFLSLFIYLCACVFYDVKNRKIPNLIQRIYFIYTYILLSIELLQYSTVIFWYILFRFLIFGLILLLSIVLFSLKLIGGGDGKVLTLLFHTIPLQYIYPFSIWFFLTLGISLIGISFYCYISRKGISSVLLKSFASGVFLNSAEIDKKNDIIRILKNKHIIPLTVPILISYFFVMLLILFNVF